MSFTILKLFFAIIVSIIKPRNQRKYPAKVWFKQLQDQLNMFTLSGSDGTAQEVFCMISISS